MTRDLLRLHGQTVTQRTGVNIVQLQVESQVLLMRRWNILRRVGGGSLSATPLHIIFELT